MNGGNDNLFARWSRRKLAARPDEAHAAPETELSPDQPVAAVDAPLVQPDSVQPEAVEAEAPEPAEPLPRLEDLTAESDLKAFLKKGVPMALKSAALRKMWSLDPGIRDYVGPSEYAWDFNQPGSMAGFGPLDAKETVVGFLSKTARAIEPDAEPTAALQPPDAPSEQPTDAPPDTATDTEAPEVSPTAESRPPVGVADTAEAISGEAEPAKQSHSPDPTKPSQVPEPLPRQRHGGAMPR